MVSVIVYGRNDSYGYNLAKRAAISLNCIAHLLDDVEDEIIFVDCNTPDDLPTFPESIADTLTPRAKNLMRVLRLRPKQYERGKNGTKFKVLEPLCRNIAIRRSNPNNRWILNTNTDMVFTPQSDGQSLSSIFSGLVDGFYELPRFELPESLWESCDRMDPEATISLFKHWGLRFHINEIVTAGNEVLYDGPGDFQLALRNQLFQIHGMNEKMILGWHLDSNLCKRMWLLNGETMTILDSLSAFHCDHTRIHTVYHVVASATENSMDDFFVNVSSPYLPEQADRWGMPDEQIEEFRLTGARVSRYVRSLELALPGMDRPISGMSVLNPTWDSGYFYDNYHVFTYLADTLINQIHTEDVGYFGGNIGLLRLLAGFLDQQGGKARIRFSKNLIDDLSDIPDNCLPMDERDILDSCLPFIVDISMKHLPHGFSDSGFIVPQSCRSVQRFATEMRDCILLIAHTEKKRLDAGSLLRHCIFVGCHMTCFDGFILELFACAHTPISTHLRSGFLRQDAFESRPFMPIYHFYVGGRTLEEEKEYISAHFGVAVSIDDLRRVTKLFNDFSLEQDRSRAGELFRSLVFDNIGCAYLNWQIMINEINGEYELAIGLKNLIEQIQNEKSS